MTVSTVEIRQAVGTGDGVNTLFPLPFKWWEKLDITVTIDGITALPSGWALVVDTNNGEPFGSSNVKSWLSFDDAPANGAMVSFQQDLPITQELDYLAFSKFDAESHEGALDKLTLLIQQVANDLNDIIISGDANIYSVDGTIITDRTATVELGNQLIFSSDEAAIFMGQPSGGGGEFPAGLPVAGIAAKDVNDVEPHVIVSVHPDKISLDFGTTAALAITDDVGTEGQVPVSHGAGTPPTWEDTNHALYGAKHSDVDTAIPLATRSLLSMESPNPDDDLAKWTLDYRTKSVAYVKDTTYYPQEMVSVQGYLSVANKETTDYPVPQTQGLPEDLYQGVSPTRSDLAKQVIFGNRYSPTEAFQLNSYRVNVIAGNTYTVFSVKDPLGAAVTTELSSFTASITGWKTLAIEPQIVLGGAVYDMVVVVNEPAGTPTTFVGNWDYQKPNQVTFPNIGEVSHANLLPSVMSIHKTDNDAGSRGAELLALIVGDIISIGGTSWTIQSVTDNATYVDFGVSPAIQDNIVGVTQLTFETVTATSITVVEDLNYWNSVTINGQGIFGIDVPYSSITPNASAYGIDLNIIQVTQSPDWDVISAPSGGSTGEETSGIGEAPVDGTPYARQDSGWVSSGAGTSDHTALTNIGTNTHVQLDTHLALTVEHIDWTVTGAENVHADRYTDTDTNIYNTDGDIPFDVERSVTVADQALLSFKHLGSLTFFQFASSNINLSASSNSVQVKSDGVYLGFGANLPLHIDGDRGLAGQALISNGIAANPTWGTPALIPFTGVHVTLNTGTILVANVEAKVVWDNETRDINNEFNTTTGTYTAKTAERIRINGQVTFGVAAAQDSLKVLVKKNGTTILSYATESANAQVKCCPFFITTDVAQEDTIEIFVINVDNADALISTNNATFMQIEPA